MQRTERRVATGVAGFALLASSAFSLIGLVPETAEAEPPSPFLTDSLPDRCEQYQGSFLDHTAAAMLQRLDVSFQPEDRVQAFPDPAFGIGSVVTLCRAPEVGVTDAGQTTVYRTWAPTVHELLAERRIELAAKDRIEPSGDWALTHGASVSITRVAETELDVVVSLPYSVQYKDDPNLERGLTRVEQPGSTGQRVETYLVRRENGVETSRTKIANEVRKEPVTEIIVRGTKVTVLDSGIASFCTNDGSVGKNCRSYMSAAHKTLPKGTKVRVVNVATGKSVVVTINDRGPYVAGRVIDLSQDAFAAIASPGAGLVTVRIEKE